MTQNDNNYLLYCDNSNAPHVRDCVDAISKRVKEADYDVIAAHLFFAILGGVYLMNFFYSLTKLVSLKLQND